MKYYRTLWWCKELHQVNVLYNYVHLDLGQIPTAVFSKISTASGVFEMMRPHGCMVLQSCYVSNFPISPGSLSPWRRLSLGISRIGRDLVRSWRMVTCRLLKTFVRKHGFSGRLDHDRRTPTKGFSRLSESKWGTLTCVEMQWCASSPLSRALALRSCPRPGVWRQIWHGF